MGMKHDGQVDTKGLEVRDAVWIKFKLMISLLGGRHVELMVSVLDSGSKGPGSNLGWGNCVVFLKELRHNIVSCFCNE